MKAFLILVDLQKDFLDHPGISPSSGCIVAAAQRALAEFRKREWPRAHVVTAVDPEVDDRMPHWKAAGTWKCVVGSDGFAEPPELAPAPDEHVIRKRWFNAFTGTSLEELIRDNGCDTVVMCGVHLHACIRETVMEAYSRDLTVVVVDDAVGSYDPLHGALSRDFLRQRAARFIPSTELIDFLTSDNASPREREVLHRSPRDPVGEVWEVRVASPEEVAQAARHASRGRVGWQATAPDDRVAPWLEVARRLEAERLELSDLMAREVGKPLRMGRQEVDLTVQMVRAVAERILRFERRAEQEREARRVALGTAAIVTPWNNPLYIPLGKIAPAAMLGNSVVWKPSPQGSRTAARLTHILAESGVPEDVVIAVTGDSGTAVELMQCEAVDAVSITGSSEAGFAAQAVCARRRIPLQAELGGNNASIVWKDTDIESAAAKIAAGAFGFAGQRCTANRRAVVDGSIYSRFIDALVAKTNELILGDPLGDETDIGPVISAEKRDRTVAMLERARRDGCRIIESSHGTADEVGARLGPTYLPPAIVGCEDSMCEIAQEESFAPVLVVLRAEGWNEALSMANGVRQGLAMSLFCDDPERQQSFLKTARAGILKINDATAGASIDVPFGGWKFSGVGPPEHGEADIEFYTRHQAVYR